MYFCHMNTQETILTQSFQLFLNEGYKEVSINKIINKCNISKGAFYYHFETKEDLYQQVLDRFFFNYFNDADFIYDEKLSFEEKLHHFIISFVTPYEELLTLTSRNDLIYYFRFLFQAAGQNKNIQYKVNKHFYKKGFYLSLLIKDEQIKNIIKTDIDPKILAQQLLSIIMGITILNGIYDATIIKSRLIESIELFVKQYTK